MEDKRPYHKHSKYDDDKKPGDTFINPRTGRRETVSSDTDSGMITHDDDGNEIRYTSSRDWW